MVQFGEGVRPAKIAMTPRGEAWLYHNAPALGGIVIHRQGVRGTVAATLVAVSP